MTLADDVRDHESHILGRESKRYQVCCRRCNSASGFARHAIRPRQFRAVEDGVVRVACSWIVRWKCMNCKCTFTDYPPFALPDKQFVKSAVFDLAASYCNHRTTTYRSPQCGQPDRSDEKGMPLPASTLWRWMNWLCERSHVAGQIVDFILKTEPLSTVHHAPGAVEPCKYRTSERETLLSVARRTVNYFIRFETKIWRPPPPTLQQANG